MLCVVGLIVVMLLVLLVLLLVLCVFQCVISSDYIASAGARGDERCSQCQQSEERVKTVQSVQIRFKKLEQAKNRRESV